MKKPVYIAGLAVLALAAVVAVLLAHSGTPTESGKTPPKEVTVFDGQGNAMFSGKASAYLYDTEYWAYLEIVFDEAAQIVAEQKDCSTAEAKEYIFAQGSRIYTAFDPEAFVALQAVDTRWEEVCNTACALTDLKGNLLAVYCIDLEDHQTNYTQEKRSPYSSFKALSVYTPAVEWNVANWSTQYEDSAYKQLTEDGVERGWPANATGTYSQKNVLVYDALRKSLNTVAVKCLKDVGITESIKFLQSSFGIPLAEEEFVVENYGEEEVIGNIALGYLETGLTPVEMAGYYQIFANGGKYTQPRTVSKILLEDGTELYSRKPEQKQVVSAGTADLMNKLLQGVVAAGGTGEGARSYDVEVAGKTGTGDGHADNWFVGVTPGYSLAVWHGQYEANQADEMFAVVIHALYSKLPDANRKFITHKNLHQIAYCTHSGKAFSLNCSLIETGYFANKDVLPVCDACKKN